MTEFPNGELEVVEDERMDELLDELRQCRKVLGRIAGWVTFFGIMAILGIALTMCNVAMGV